MGFSLSPHDTRRDTRTLVWWRNDIKRFYSLPCKDLKGWTMFLPRPLIFAFNDCKHIHIYEHTYTSTHLHIHTYTHTHIHTRIPYILWVTFGLTSGLLDFYFEHCRAATPLCSGFSNEKGGNSGWNLERTLSRRTCCLTFNSSWALLLTATMYWPLHPFSSAGVHDLGTFRPSGLFELLELSWCLELETIGTWSLLEP